MKPYFFVKVIFSLCLALSQTWGFSEEAIPELLFVETNPQGGPARYGAADDLVDYLRSRPDELAEIAESGTLRLILPANTENVVELKELLSGRIKALAQELGIQPRLIQRLTGFPEIILIRVDLDELLELEESTHLDTLVDELNSQAQALDRALEQSQGNWWTPYLNVVKKMSKAFRNAPRASVALIKKVPRATLDTVRALPHTVVNAAKSTPAAAVKAAKVVVNAAGQAAKRTVMAPVTFCREAVFVTKIMVKTFRKPFVDLSKQEMTRAFWPNRFPLLLR